MPTVRERVRDALRQRAGRAGEALLRYAGDGWALGDGRPPSKPAQAGPPAVETRELTRVYGEGPTGVRALDGVTLVIGRGEMVAIMGPSGSGKSTLLHLLGALETPSGGSIALAGRHYEGLGDRELTLLRRDTIGFVFQFFNLLPALTAAENVMLPALIAGRRDAGTRARASELLTRVGLAARTSHLPTELSGGEQQRVSIARALLLEPELVLADEPTGNLDSHSGAEILELLAELNRGEGHTIVMVTHDPNVASIAGRVLFMRDGRLAGEVGGGSAERVIETATELESIA
jgi:putative ABC transport system ATP-binding protein